MCVAYPSYFTQHHAWFVWIKPVQELPVPVVLARLLRSHFPVCPRNDPSVTSAARNETMHSNHLGMWGGKKRKAQTPCSKYSGSKALPRWLSMRLGLSYSSLIHLCAALPRLQLSEWHTDPLQPAKTSQPETDNEIARLGKCAGSVSGHPTPVFDPSTVTFF